MKPPRFKTIKTGRIKWPHAEYERAAKRGRFVITTLTEAQRIQLAGKRCTYRDFLRVATHDQLVALKETVPLCWAHQVMTSEGGREPLLSPHHLHSLRGRGPNGIDYAWMTRARATLAAELKRRGMSVRT